MPAEEITDFAAPDPAPAYAAADPVTEYAALDEALLPVEPAYLTAQPDAVAEVDAETPLPENDGPQVITSPDQEVSAHVRRFHYRLRVTVRGAYDDNINLSNVNPVEDYYVSVEPSLMLGFGAIEGGGDNFLKAEYTPIFTAFMENTQFNTLQHTFQASGQWKLSRLTLGLSQQIQLLEGPDIDLLSNLEGVTFSNVNIDAGGRQKTNIYGTTLTAAYDFTGKTFVSSTLNWGLSDPEGLIGTQTFSGDLFLNYRYSQKLTVGLGGGAGQQFVEAPSPDSHFEEARVRLGYDATGKVQFNGSAGVQFRHSDGDNSTYTTPVFQLGMNYKPFDGTTVNISGTRRTTASAALAGQDFAATEFVGSIRQRFLGRFLLGLTGGYSNLAYFGSASGVSGGREDNYYFIQPSVDVRLTNFWFVGLYAVHRENDSTATLFSFEENQAGLRTGLQF